MFTFEVADMTCGHCVSTITKAVQSVDQGAKVQADLATHRVRVDSAVADTQKCRDAITVAGYTPMRVQDAPVLAAVPTRLGRCCCD